MDASTVSMQSYYSSASSIRSSSSSISLLSTRVSFVSSSNTLSKSRSSFRLRRPKNRFLASSSNTLVAGSCEGDGKVKEDDDLKSWMHANGLPPCKVMLKEKPSHNPKHRPIHYVAASEDLQAGDIAFSVPDSLVVTLERVLGNETVE